MSKLRILHVEDERNARLMVADLIGGDVALVSLETAAEALEACWEAAFDLTLLDWTLRGMKGGEFLTAVRDTGRAGRVGVRAGPAGGEELLRAPRAGRGPQSGAPAPSHHHRVEGPRCQGQSPMWCCTVGTINLLSTTACRRRAPRRRGPRGP